MTTASEDRYMVITARRNRKSTARQLNSELAAATVIVVNGKWYTEGVMKRAVSS